MCIIRKYVNQFGCEHGGKQNFVSPHIDIPSGCEQLSDYINAMIHSQQSDLLYSTALAKAIQNNHKNITELLSHYGAVKYPSKCQ